ncbi:phytanoyl-CoA dioxygenase family protein [Candidatus Berkiella aquae]|uniref:Kanamycin B dioxygenase n=1 Tax=Candidatus Berkiella aquae TaxID=295108 RepID=A0A0Q9YGT1_9GAMM|nr:phytanoyl-CoA dioxygenase family protein [Candidatus Berkiella aquae]MCS5710821.1 phytanoyl-CoA dioxygenase family protein [Candidatus Berkiella aquae]
MKAFTLFFLTLIFSPINYAQDLNYNKHLNELNNNGVTIIPQVYSQQEIEAFQIALNPVVQKIESLMKTPGIPRYFNNDGKKTASYYWQIDNDLVLQAGPGRFDTRYQLNKGIFADSHFQHNPIIEKLIQKVLHSRYTNYTGVVFAAPGSGDQYWHRDTDNIADSDIDGTQLVRMDDFYFTVLIPLVNMNKENGTTEFMLTTHRKTMEEYPLAKTAQFDLKAGDVIIFNGKINHRGRANLSQSPRPVLYNVYYKKWYNDSYREGIN